MDKQSEASDARSSDVNITKHSDVNASLAKVNLLDNAQLVSAEAFLKRFMSSEKGGIKTLADGIAILARAQDLNLPFTTCIEHIHVINGKTGIDVHIIKSLLSRAGVVWECVKDYAPQYQYTDGNTIYLETQLPDYCVKCRTSKEAEEATKDDAVGVYPVKWYTDLAGNIYNEAQVSDKCVVAINKAHALKLKADGKFPIIRVPARPVDFVTEYKFTRTRTIGGKEVVSTCTSHFSFSEATEADMFSKDTYKKYARVMIGHRAFSLGARDIASDLLMGCMETTELKQVVGVGITDDDVIDTSYEEVN